MYQFPAEQGHPAMIPHIPAIVIRSRRASELLQYITQPVALPVRTLAELHARL
jgi:hypothetical protein